MYTQNSRKIHMAIRCGGMALQSYTDNESLWRFICFVLPLLLVLLFEECKINSSNSPDSYIIGTFSNERKSRFAFPIATMPNEVAEQISQGRESHNIWNYNGNTIGIRNMCLLHLLLHCVNIRVLLNISTTFCCWMRTIRKKH